MSSLSIDSKHRRGKWDVIINCTPKTPIMGYREKWVRYRYRLLSVERSNWENKRIQEPEEIPECVFN